MRLSASSWLVFSNGRLAPSPSNAMGAIRPFSRQTCTGSIKTIACELPGPYLHLSAHLLAHDVIRYIYLLSHLRAILLRKNTEHHSPPSLTIYRRLLLYHLKRRRRRAPQKFSFVVCSTFDASIHTSRLIRFRSHSIHAMQQYYAWSWSSLKLGMGRLTSMSKAHDQSARQRNAVWYRTHVLTSFFFHVFLLLLALYCIVVGPRRHGHLHRNRSVSSIQYLRYHSRNNHPLSIVSRCAT